MARKLSKKAKIIISSVVVFVLLVGGVVLWAADRYLIEHVEIDLNQPDVPGSSLAVEDTISVTGSASTKDLTVTPKLETTKAQKVEPTAAQKEDPKAKSKEDSKAGAKAEQTAAPKASASQDKKEEAQAKNDGEEKFTATDMSYSSSSKTINIKKVVNGQDADTVTYYVADIKLTDAKQMKSAFAKNKFGLNIIEGTSEIANANNAIVAINGDYYGFREDGIEIRNGRLFRDKPARTGLAFYKDGSMKIYDEKQTTGEALLANGVWSTLSFGPALLNEGAMGADLATYEVDTNVGNHPIQGLQPRTGIGIIDNNHYMFVVVDGRSKGYSKGVELEELANIFKSLGCKTAYNLDGGGSSTMYFMGKRINKPVGKEKERGTSDIIYVK